MTKDEILRIISEQNYDLTEPDRRAFQAKYNAGLFNCELEQEPQLTPSGIHKIGCVNHDCQHCKEMKDWEGIAADQAMTIALMKSEQHEQEPNGYVQTVIEALYENGDPVSVDAAELLQRITAQPEQEPVALQEREAFEAWYDRVFANRGHAAHHRFSSRDAYCIDEIQNQWEGWKGRARLISPPKPQPLTNEQIDALRQKTPPSAGVDFNIRCRDFARAIEAKLKELNHG